MVSDTFSEQDLEDATTLTSTMKEDRSWKMLKAEATGITNLARVATLTDEENTVFARIDLNVDQAGVKKFTFGYSDRARVYLNGQLLYSGDNGYRTRDYRYLGTIGHFDHVYLPLNAGNNELWVAVSESFGGWGIQATFEDTEGISW